METFDSLEDIQEAYQKLLSLQRTQRNKLFSGGDVDWEEFRNRLSRQSELMETINRSGTLDRKFQENRTEEFRTLMTEFKKLRDELSQEITERRDELEKQFDSLDQSEQLLDEYDQGTDASYHLDETI